MACRTRLPAVAAVVVAAAPRGREESRRSIETETKARQPTARTKEMRPPGRPPGPIAWSFVWNGGVASESWERLDHKAVHNVSSIIIYHINSKFSSSCDVAMVRIRHLKPSKTRGRVLINESIDRHQPNLILDTHMCIHIDRQATPPSAGSNRGGSIDAQERGRSQEPSNAFTQRGVRR